MPVDTPLLYIYVVYRTRLRYCIVTTELKLRFLNLYYISKNILYKFYLMCERQDIDKDQLRTDLCKVISTRFNGTLDPEAYGDYLLELIIQYKSGLSSKEEAIDSIISLFNGFVSVFIIIVLFLCFISLFSTFRLILHACILVCPNYQKS